MPKLTYVDSQGAPREALVRGEPVTIGRSAECDVRLADAGVSRLHAVVEPSGGRLLVRDQESRGGTWVNGAQVTDAELADGDEIRVGGVALSVSLSAGGASTRRSGRPGAGAGEEDAEGVSARRTSRRPRREILGGIRLSRTQQTIVKIVCAAVMVISAFCIVWLINHWRSRQPVVPRTRRIYVNQEDEPKRLFGEARELARSAREAEQTGRTREARDLILEAKGKAERARELITELAEKHPGPTYWRLHNLAAEIAQQAQTISSEAFTLEQQVERDGAGGD